MGTDYDGSMVPAEWYGWLHHKSDETPVQVCVGCVDGGGVGYRIAEGRGEPDTVVRRQVALSGSSVRVSCQRPDVISTVRMRPWSLCRLQLIDMC